MVLLAHELGHSVDRLPNGIHNRTLNEYGETFDGLYYDQRARQAFGCAPRPHYDAMPACFQAR
jgi:hypothetical protein